MKNPWAWLAAFLGEVMVISLAISIALDSSPTKTFDRMSVAGVVGISLLVPTAALVILALDYADNHSRNRY